MWTKRCKTRVYLYACRAEVLTMHCVMQHGNMCTATKCRLLLWWVPQSNLKLHIEQRLTKPFDSSTHCPCPLDILRKHLSTVAKWCSPFKVAPQLHCTTVAATDGAAQESTVIQFDLLVWPLVLPLAAQYWIIGFQPLWKNQKIALYFCHSSFSVLSLCRPLVLSARSSSLLYFNKVKLLKLWRTKEKCPLLFCTA